MKYQELGSYTLLLVLPSLYALAHIQINHTRREKWVDVAIHGVMSALSSGFVGTLLTEPVSSMYAQHMELSIRKSGRGWRVVRWWIWNTLFVRSVWIRCLLWSLSSGTLAVLVDQTAVFSAMGRHPLPTALTSVYSETTLFVSVFCSWMAIWWACHLIHTRLWIVHSPYGNHNVQCPEDCPIPNNNNNIMTNTASEPDEPTSSFRAILHDHHDQPAPPAPPFRADEPGKTDQESSVVVPLRVDPSTQSVVPDMEATLETLSRKTNVSRSILLLITPPTEILTTTQWTEIALPTSTSNSNSSSIPVVPSRFPNAYHLWSLLAILALSSALYVYPHILAEVNVHVWIWSVYLLVISSLFFLIHMRPWTRSLRFWSLHHVSWILTLVLFGMSFWFGVSLMFYSRFSLELVDPSDSQTVQVLVLLVLYLSFLVMSSLSEHALGLLLQDATGPYLYPSLLFVHQCWKYACQYSVFGFPFRTISWPFAVLLVLTACHQLSLVTHFYRWMWDSCLLICRASTTSSRRQEDPPNLFEQVASTLNDTHVYWYDTIAACTCFSTVFLTLWTSRVLNLTPAGVGPSEDAVENETDFYLMLAGQMVVRILSGWVGVRHLSTRLQQMTSPEAVQRWIHVHQQSGLYCLVDQCIERRSIHRDPLEHIRIKREYERHYPALFRPLSWREGESGSDIFENWFPRDTLLQRDLPFLLMITFLIHSFTWSIPLPTSL